MRYKILFLILLFIPSLAYGAVPALNFSDIISGPSTGLGDELGSGAIVTIWGNNLGSSQGSSTLSICGTTPAHVYYWKDADGSLPGGPADLSTYHKMQEIAFSVPSSCSIGATTITVTTSEGVSNGLPFTVNTGAIKFVKSTGKDSGDGTWADPYLTLGSTFAGGNGKLAEGTIVYSVGVGSTTGIRVGANAQVAGNADNHIALVVYPNTSSDISGLGGDASVVDNYWPSRMHNEYVDFSKLSVTAYGNASEQPNGFSVIPYGRIVGVEITGPNVYGGVGGAITGTGGVPQGGKYLGIYMHNYGWHSGWEFVDDYRLWNTGNYDGIAGIDCTNCTTIDNKQHLYYVSCRGGSGVHCEGHEIGWNYLVDNPILESIHIYDMAPSEGWYGTLSVHDNVLVNQRGKAIDIATTTASTADIEVYNNLIINTEGQAFSLVCTGDGTETTKVYNNTTYGFTLPSSIGSTATTVDYSNNIMVDTGGITFFSSVPSIHSNNLFYSTSSAAQPSWAGAEAGNVTGDPLFTNAAGGDFSLQVLSPAIDAGYDTSVLVERDIFSVIRPQQGSIDVGAFEAYGRKPSNWKFVSP